MNRYEANRLAKQIFMAYGLHAGHEDVWAEIENQFELGNAESKLVHDYYKRCANRVSDWLRL